MIILGKLVLGTSSSADRNLTTNYFHLNDIYFPRLKTDITIGSN